MRAAALLLLAGVPAGAAVTSPAPDAVSVTVYRDPNRGEGGTLSLGYLNGYALVTETRTVDVPAGASEIRFEGVAGGIVPVSAIVTGLPGGVIQKNRDARLLSPAALVDGTLGGRVHLRRTSRATGRTIEEDAFVRAGPGGGVVVETARGVEALRCSGLPETLVYDGVPEGLSARPVLSVTTRSPAAMRATVTLSYLADRFDWNADYVVEIAEDGRTLDLFAWLTLANGNGESFLAAQTQAVAGTVRRPQRRSLEQVVPEPALALECWPMDGTSTHPSWEIEGMGPPPPPPPPPPAAPPPPPAPEMAAEDIVLTAQRRGAVRAKAVAAITAEQEELGDLKLYRVPEPVTVAARSQKQVALLVKSGVPFDRIHKAVLNAAGEERDRPTRVVLRTRNLAAKQLGAPLPSGGVAVFDDGLLVGESRLRDVAVGEEFEIDAAASPQVRISQSGEGKRGERRLVTLTNAGPKPATVEVRFVGLDERGLPGATPKVVRKDGEPTWIATVPANGDVTLRYRVPRER